MYVHIIVAGNCLSNVVICNISSLTREEKIIENLIPKNVNTKQFLATVFCPSFR